VVTRLVRADRRRKWQVRLLGFVCIGVLVLAGLNFRDYVAVRALTRQNQHIVHAVRAGSIASCEAGNRARSTNKLIWGSFLNLLIDNPETAAQRELLLAELKAAHLPPAETRALTILITTQDSVPRDSVRIVHQFEAYIAAHEFPVDCAKAYASAALG
jgi:hypothetical protein